jgi:hypothetical protein
MYRVEEAPELFARQLGIKPATLLHAINAPEEFTGALQVVVAHGQLVDGDGCSAGGLPVGGRVRSWGGHV